MPTELPFDDALAARLPLPLAQLLRRAANAKTARDRHDSAYYLWEAGLKLLGAGAVVAYADLPEHDPALTERLKNLARPAVGHWWEFVRLLAPRLAERGAVGFGPVRELLFGKPREDLPRAAGLNAALQEALQGKASARSTVQLAELFDRLVSYRNKEIGHGAVGQKPTAHYDKLGRALLLGLAEVFSKLDVLAGQRLLYIAEVRRRGDGAWIVERADLSHERYQRVESLVVPADAAETLPHPERLYLETPTTARPDGPLRLLHPLLLYDAEADEVQFLNARRGKARVEYLAYNSGRVLERAELAGEQRVLLRRVLDAPDEQMQFEAWQAQSAAEEPLDPATESAPRQLGEYELLTKLGQGGMGIVYRARQPSLGRQVALKCLFRTGDPKAEARFAREISALGRVDHPHLVKIFASGAEGEHWFYAMELIEGATLAAVCTALQARARSAQELDLPTWQRVVSTACTEAHKQETPVSGPSAEGAAPVAPAPASPSEAVPGGSDYVHHVVDLVRQVSDAAHALHEKRIIHRDIKPGNIMVGPDGCGAVLMDLGLAQVADEVEGRLTRTRQFVGTLRYASPEQVLAVNRLDRRSDVYSLGATLWELLALRPLFDATEATPSPDLMQRIQIEEPSRLRKFNAAVPRDLEAIVDKCLQKDARRRYATARELSADLEHFLQGKPVRARPVTRLERTAKWARRRPTLAALLAVVVLGTLGLMAGGVYFTFQLDRAREKAEGLAKQEEKQRKDADQRRLEAEAISNFYEEHVLAAARPKGWAGGAGKDVTLKEALDQATPKVSTAFADQPELEAGVRNTLGMTYWYLGEFDAANPHLEKAYQIRLERLGADDHQALASLYNLARLRWRQDNGTKAIALARDALTRQRRVLGPEHQDTLWTQLYLGLFLMEEQHVDEAETLLIQAIETCKRTRGPDDVQTLFGQNDLALVLGRKGKLKEAVALNRVTLDGRRRSLGTDHPDTLRSLDNLAWSLQEADQLEEAEALCRQGLEGRRRVLGEGHTETFWSLNNLAGILAAKGKLTEAEEQRRQAVKDSERLRGLDDPQTLKSLTQLGYLLRDLGKLDEAGSLFRMAVERSVQKLGSEHRSTLLRQNQLAWLLKYQGKVKEAEALYRKTLAVQLRVRGPEHQDTLSTRNNLAVLLHNERRNAEAETLFREVLTIRERILGPDHPDTVFSKEALAASLRIQGNKDHSKLAEAERLYRSSLEARQRRNGPEHSQTLISLGYLAFCLKLCGKVGEAEELYRRLLATQRKLLPEDHPDIAGVLASLGSLLSNTGRAAEADPLLRECLAIREKKLPPSNWRIASARSLLGGCLVRQKKFAEAESLLLASHEGLTKATDAPRAQAEESLERVIELYETWGMAEKAEEWRKKRPLAENK